MTRAGGGALTTALDLARAAYGAALTAAPGPLTRLAAGAPAPPVALTVARVLGVRHLAQAAATATRPEPAVLAAGSAADLLHAASLLALAATSAKYRRLALTDAVAAATFAATGVAAARQAGMGS